MEEEYEVKASAAQNRVSYIGAFLYLFSIYASLLWFWCILERKIVSRKSVIS